ncbi:tryptophan synthase beta subunit-like PLP-dependent enzyme [Paraphysoderma sedebokerense]|nr:tryptophan synthase beta subunit-like PLP-dependent enzyme [Paraphysoderma sedebokerense]
MLRHGSENYNAYSFTDSLKLPLVYDVAKETPTTFATNLSERLGNNIYLKREDLQPVFSFKIRGAYNKLKSLTDEEKLKGVICVSAGNHAQGVAMAAKKLGVNATIVMPETSPSIKIKSVKKYGVNVLLKGRSFDEAKKFAFKLSQEHGYINISAYDDPYIIAGQGTVAMEILRQIKSQELSAVFVCCGGGGLLAGISVYLKRLFPDIKVIGVEEVGQDSMRQALMSGEPVQLSDISLFADGTAVGLVGSEPFRLCKEYVDEIVLVSNDEICAAIKDAFEDTRSILEPSGALALAGLKRWVADNPCSGKTLVAVTSGSNIDFNRLRFVAERAEIGEETEALISVNIPERPGSFWDLYTMIHPRPITELSYRYNHSDKGHVFVSFNVSKNRDEELAELFPVLTKHGMQGIDVSRNEMAKSHARYLMGGRLSVPNERLFRFEFRDRPEVIQDILSCFRGVFNQSLFHYKQSGPEGRILVGVQVPAEKEGLLQEKLKALKYSWMEETDNIVYKHFFIKY